LVPKLRFPEFHKALSWTIKKLNQLLIEAKRRNRSLELGPNDVLSVSGEYGCVNQIEFMGRSYAGASVKEYHVVEHGDIVYTKSPLKKNPYGIIKENKGKRGIVSTLYAVYRPLPGCSPTYLDHFFSGDYNLNAYLQPIVKKGAKNDMKVNNADVLKGNICVPEIQEQQKIADCLSSLDELTTAHARKLNTLKIQKKGLMQQLFPREGETQPRLRFPEFRNAEEWVTRPLLEVAPLQRGFDLPSDEIRHGMVPIIYSNGPKGFHRSGMATGPGIVTGRSGTIGKIHFVESGEYWPHNTSLWVTSFKGHSPRFVFYLYKSIGFLRFSSGSGVPTLNRNDAHAFVTGIPLSMKEQQRIADCLTSLDALITAVTQELATLKTHKRGLMQQLFPSAEAVEA